MASSDEECETLPQSVTNYYFVDDNNEPISFSILPIQWGEDSCQSALASHVYLHGTTDGGLQKIHKQVTAWKLNLSNEELEISVLCKDNSWIKLQKPRKSYEDIIRSILVTVHCIHFIKRDPECSDKVLWDYLRKKFSYEDRPSENDLFDNLPLIKSIFNRDEELAKSKFLSAFLDNPKKRKSLDEDITTGSDTKKSKFIVEDEVDEDADLDESDEEPDSFDPVCAICDNGGELLCCEGRCFRSFHATRDAGSESQCASLGMSRAQVKAIQNFLCTNCQLKQHQCFVCGRLGSSDKSAGAEVFSCVSATCGKFYHPDCVSKLLHAGNEVETEEERKKIAAGEAFTCPIHKCIICKKGENKDVEELQFAICRRCPKAYHRKCLPRKISFDDIEEEDIVQRAWDDLIPNRILIYCLRHAIDENIGTPVRNHIKFPETAEKKKLRPVERVFKKKDAEAFSNEKISTSRLKKVGEKKDGRDLVSKSGEFKKTKEIASPRLFSKSVDSRAGKLSTLEKSTPSLLNRSSDSVKAKPKILNIRSQEMNLPTSSSLPAIDGETEKRLLTLIKKSASSITLDDLMKMHKLPSTHSHSSRHVDKTITAGKVEGSVEALRTALKKLQEGCSIEDAKAVCGPDILFQIIKWKNKLKVYLAPFLHGMRYTSFGRHFTKVDKLKEIVEKLHWYVQNGDMIVDFCCGANDFSRLMKSKLDEVGKECYFKNYDVIQPKDDFNFEKRDWMTVRQEELPAGSKLIMGLNPPFGVKAALANKFIDKALEFKPKLVILIVPKDTERLDVKKHAYDLIWEDETSLSGKSFYLPGSVDIHDKQMEQWNLKPPLLYLWSRPDWTAKNKGIAARHGHISKQPEETSVKENQEQAVRGQEGGKDMYGDISKRMGDLPSHDQSKLHEERNGISADEPMDISPPPEHETRIERSRQDYVGRQGTENERYKMKRSSESFMEKESGWEGRKNQSGSKDENHKGKRGSIEPPVGDFYDKEKHLSSDSPLKRPVARGFFEDHASEEDNTLQREDSDGRLQHFQYDRSGSIPEYGAGHGTARRSIPDDELTDIERKYRNKDDSYSSGMWSTSRSGLHGVEERLSTYPNDKSVDDYGRKTYSDGHSRLEAFGQQNIDTLDKYRHSSTADALRHASVYSRHGPPDVQPHRSQLSFGQDSVLGQPGLTSNYPYGHSASPDPSRLGSSVSQHYARGTSQLEEMNYARSTSFLPNEVQPSDVFRSQSSQAGLLPDAQGFAMGRHRHFPHGSSGWLKD